MVAEARCWGWEDVMSVVDSGSLNQGATRKWQTEMSREENWNEQCYKTKLIWGPCD